MGDDAVDKLLERAAELPYGAAKIAVLEQALSHADTHCDERMGYVVRQELLWPAYHGNRPDLVLVHYAWCLAYLDRHPDLLPFETLWQYRWVVDTMPHFAAIRRDQIESAWQDMHNRYQAGGWSLRPVWLNRRRILAKMGDKTGAADAHRRYYPCRFDLMSDDPAQDASFAVDYSEFRRLDAQTVRLTLAQLNDPLADAHKIISAANDGMLALLRKRKYAEAQEAFMRAFQQLTRNRQFWGSASRLLIYRTVTSDFTDAVRFFGKEFPAAVTEPGEFGRISSYHAGLFLARRLTDAGRRLQLQVPAGFVPGQTMNRVSAVAFRDHLEVALPELAAQADHRNGNLYQTEQLDDLAEYAELAQDYARTQL